MSYSVNWITKIISIPTTDLVLVSGARYRLEMSSFLHEIRRLEADPTQGLWADQILDHTNPKTLAGVTFAPFDEIINGYTIQFTGAATRVDLAGSNNNLIDVLIPTGVAVVPNNSAGLQIVTVNTGASALTNEQDTMLRELHRLDGLDPSRPLVVSDTTRTAGAEISQTVVTTPTTTTVTRV